MNFFKKAWPIFLVVLLSYFAIRNIAVPGYFAMHDDLQAMRQLQLSKCFADGQFPCRWVPDMGYLFGYPLFNFYPPFPYYLGQPFVWLGLQFIDVVKITTILSFLVSGVLMYLLAKEFWGRAGAVVSALFYVYAPYHAIDIYVRGAMNEGWALAWFPGVYWAIYKLIKTGKWIWVVPLSVFTAFLLLTHNPMTMIFAPTAILWALFWMWRFGSRPIKKLAISGIWAFGLAAFFTLPVVFEQRYAHLETLIIGYFNYLAHFVDLNQLFITRFWGFGASELGPVDGMSFTVGHLHWMSALLVLVVGVALWKKKRDLSLMIFMVFGITLFYTFLMHSKSTPIWKVVKPLEFLQFPWRFLSYSIFGTSFLVGALVWFLKKHKAIIGALLIAGAIFTYAPFFTWREYYPSMTDEEKFSGNLWQLQLTSSIFDYLPIWAELPPVDPPSSAAEFISGSGSYELIEKKSNLQSYKVSVENAGSFLINSLYFPGWIAQVDGRRVEIDPEIDEELGRVVLELDEGDHKVEIRFTETPVRRVADIISLFSWGGLLYIGFTRGKKNSKP